MAKTQSARTQNKQIMEAAKSAEQFFKADLQALNGSGVSGEVLIFFDHDTGKLTVIVNADGLEPGQVHLQHIHGFTEEGRVAVIPGAEADLDQDGFLEFLEGAPDYGGVLLNVALNHEDGTGADNGHSHDGAFSGFPTAPNGTIRFIETYDLASLNPATDPLEAMPDIENYHFVIHGLSLGAGDGIASDIGFEADGTAGYKLVLPAAIGDFEEITRMEAMREVGGVRRDFAQDRAETRREMAADRRAERKADDDGPSNHGDWMMMG
ncbi:MAG TPA: hypothetical protein VD929_00235 [Caulobacteraceae bacterium]|nr:hypothetical protein [Caulobacteraceae bacterium]